MKITDVKPCPVWVGRRNQLLVMVEAGDCFYGRGESDVSGRELAIVGTSPVEDYPVGPELLHLQHKLHGTRFPVPTRRGLGGQVDESPAAQGEFKFSEPRRILGRDRSYQSRKYAENQHGLQP